MYTAYILEDRLEKLQPVKGEEREERTQETKRETKTYRNLDTEKPKGRKRADGGIKEIDQRQDVIHPSLHSPKVKCLKDSGSSKMSPTSLLNVGVNRLKTDTR